MQFLRPLYGVCYVFDFSNLLAVHPVGNGLIHPQRTPYTSDPFFAQNIKQTTSGLQPLLLGCVVSTSLSACGMGVVNNGKITEYTAPKKAADGSIVYTMNVMDAHQDGNTGKGVMIAIVDTGVSTDADDLEGRISKKSVYVDSMNTNYRDRVGHGTNMAHIIGSTGAKTNLVGMAPGSELLVVRTDTDKKPGAPYANLVADGIDYAVEEKADIINLSLSSDDANIIDAIHDAVENSHIVAIATGNNSKYGSPSKMAYEAGNYGDTAIAVTAVDAKNEIALFAAPCDVADPKYCVAAPGERIPAVDKHGEKGFATGTSPATAVVSGGIALLKQHFPKLTNAEIVEILLSTAQDLGEKGVDTVYGSGLVDFAAAMSPVGTVTVSSLDSNAQMSGSTAELSKAFGGALAEVAALKSVPIKDGYGRNFNIDIRSKLSAKKPHMDRLDLLADMRISHQTSQFGPMTLSYSSLSDSPMTNAVEDDWYFTASFTPNADTTFHFASTNTQRDMSATEYNFHNVQSDPMKSAFSLSGDRFTSFGYQTTSRLGHLKTRVELIESEGFGVHEADTLVSLGYETNNMNGFAANATLSALQEHGSILGARFTGAFGEIARTRSVAATLGGTYQTNTFDLFLSGSFGKSSVDMEHAGLIADFQDVTFSQWNFGIGFASVFTGQDRLAFGLGQPLRIEGGKAVFFDDSEHNLRSSGREINAEMSYRANIEETSIAASFLYGRNIGHVNTQGNQFQGAILLSRAF